MEIENETNVFLEELEKTVNLNFNERFVLPGDDITEIITSFTKEINIGKEYSLSSFSLFLSLSYFFK